MIPNLANSQNQAPQSQINISQTTAVKCEVCENDVFNTGVLLRKVSALLSPLGKEVMVQVPVHYCASCSHVNSDFIPNELKNSIS